MKRQIKLHKRGRVRLLSYLILIIKWPKGLLSKQNGLKLLAISLLFTLIIFASLFVYAFYWYFSHDLPDLTKITGYRPHLTTEVYSIDGKLVAEFGGERRTLIPYEGIPKHVKQSFMAIEDKRFFEHNGVDLRRILGALLKNVEEGEIVQGGSTITQQVVKNLALSSERSLSRKIKEAILAYRMERNLSKGEILYIYLNHIYFGDGTYGIEAASRDYFGKSAKDISLAEAAFLAAIPKAPTYYSPREHFGRVKSRQELILKIMEDGGFITKEQRKKAGEYPIKIIPKRNINLEVAPYFVELVRQYMEARFGTKALIDGGYTVFTTLDVDLSLKGAWALRRGIIDLETREGKPIVIGHLNNRKQIENFRKSQKLDSIDKGESYRAVVTSVTKKDSLGVLTSMVGIGEHQGILRFVVSSPLGSTIEGLQKNAFSEKFAPLNGYNGISLVPFELKVGDIVWVEIEERNSMGVYYVSIDLTTESQGALLSMDTNLGYIKAIIGGFNFSGSQFNRATQALRQPGSAFKPIIYAAAIDKGYTETTIVSDTPVTAKDWSPQNYDGHFLGEIPMREALAKSRNLASVRIIMDINPHYAVRYAKKFGFTSNLSPYPALALGGSDVTLLDMVKAFNVFATGGKLIKPRFILRIYDRDGRLVEDNTVLQSREELEKAEREKKRMEIIKQIAASSNDTEVNAAEFIRTERKKDNEQKSDTEFLTADEFLKILRNGDFSQLNLSSNMGEQVISPETAFIMINMLQDVIKEGTGHKALELSSLAPIAGKTGTANDFTDAWFIGFSPRVITGVWVGKDDHKPIGEGEVGSSTALPIWIDFMREALEKFPNGNFMVPDGIQFVNTPYGYIPYKADSIPDEIKTEEGVGRNQNHEERNNPSESEIDFLIRH
jgi:penicillin-binding protein 1A